MELRQTGHSVLSLARAAEIVSRMATEPAV
jgi:hypothetical protein